MNDPVQFQAAVAELRDRLNNILHGKREVVEHVLTCLLARGHILLEDLPGLGKTTLARGLTEAVGGRFARLQCTPDLLPNDITGFNLFNQKSREFEFVPGPVFSDVLLADEINRATPRAQSALLEAMAERQVTVDNERHHLCDEFFVIATQNPIEHHGTYPLPEAQLDRFAMKLSIGYPAFENEVQMLQDAVAMDTDDEASCSPVLQPGDLARMQATVAGLTIVPKLQEYLVQLANVTRDDAAFSHGLSPRAVLMWQRLAQARAFLDGRSFVTPDDIQVVAPPLFHIHISGAQQGSTKTVEDVLAKVVVPTDIERGRTVVGKGSS